MLLAIPGLGAGAILTLSSRKISNDAALPMIMVAIPASFYLLLWIKGESLDSARESGWVGAVAPPVPVSDLFGLIDFSLVKWSLCGKILSTWCGMVRFFCCCKFDFRVEIQIRMANSLLFENKHFLNFHNNLQWQKWNIRYLWCPSPRAWTLQQFQSTWERRWIRITNWRLWAFVTVRYTFTEIPEQI